MDTVRAAGAGVELARVAYGAALVRRPHRMDRVLGARLLVQGAATAARGGDAGAHGVGAGVDALHALSMVGLAAVSRSWRRRALVSAAGAAGFAAAEAALFLAAG